MVAAFWRLSSRLLAVRSRLSFRPARLAVAILGLYAVMTYLVTMRVHEIGVRMALGATARDVTRLAMSQALRLTIVGVVIGLGLAGFGFVRRAAAVSSR